MMAGKELRFRRLLVGTALALGAAMALTLPAAGQQVSFSGRPEGGVQRSLVSFLERGNFDVITRDTLLDRDASIGKNLLILEASVRIAGQVDGSVYVVDGDLFLRPDAHISGEVVVLGGGYYASSLATVQGGVTYRPREQLRVLPEAGGHVIFGWEEPLEAFEFDGLYGVQLPTYQRVDALTLGWGAVGRGLDLAWQPDLYVAARVRSFSGEVEASMRQYWHPSRRFGFGLEASRATRTNEDWIRRGWVNSLFYFLVGDDFRDYFEADRVELGGEWLSGTGWQVQVKGRWENARSIEAHDMFTLFGPDGVRPNPEIDDGQTYSLLSVADFERRNRRSHTRLRIGLEGASRDIGGDFSFLLGEAQLDVRAPAFLDHSIELFVIGRGDLAGRLPRQRWSAIGGIGTLPTLPILSLRGERIVFGDIAYAVPLFSLARLSSFDLLLRGAAGAAWSEGESLQLKTTASFAARVAPVEVGVAVGPRAGEDGADVRVYLDIRFSRGPRVP
jgi:hypothetical protein